MHDCEQNDTCVLDPNCPHVDRCWLTEERLRNDPTSAGESTMPDGLGQGEL